MHKSLRIGLAVLLSSSAAFFSACSSYNDPEPAQPDLVQALSSATTDASTIAAAQTWFTRVSQQSAHPVGIDWPQARTAGNWVVAPLVDSLNIFAQVPQQGFRYLVVQVQATGACNGRIVEVMLPTKSLTADQALTTVLAGVQPLVAGASPVHLGAFTGCVFVYSPTYAYQTGLLYQNGVAQGQRVRLRAQRSAPVTTSARFTEPTPTSEPQNLLQVCETITVTTSVDGRDVGGYTTVSCTTIDTGSGGGGGGGGWGGGSSTGGGGGTGTGGNSSNSSFETIPTDMTVEPDFPSDCASWNFAPVGPNGYMACGVENIEIDLLSFFSDDDNFGLAYNVYQATLYFEMPPRYTPGEAATICAAIKDEIEEEFERRYRNRYPPHIAQTINSAFIREMKTRISSLGGRVTLTPQYPNTPVNAYQHTTLPNNGGCM